MVVEKFDPLRGGLEQWTYRLVQKLVQRGHEIHVVSREFSPAPPPCRWWPTRSAACIPRWPSPPQRRRNWPPCRWT